MEPGGSLAVTLSETGRIDGAMDKSGEVGDVDGALGGDFLRLRIDFPTSPDVDFFAYRPDLQTDGRSIRANVNGTLVDLSWD